MAFSGKADSPFNSSWRFSKGKPRGGNTEGLYKSNGQVGAGGDLFSVAYADAFFGSLSTTGQIKYWDGSAWTIKPVKYWDGSSWVTKPVKWWNGSSWVVTNY